MAFTKILIANRGEIALRVIRTARALGYRTVAVYSEADANALHVQAADEAVCIGPPTVSQSYLNIAAIVQAAKHSGAEAVHPGYGFLSENEDFARACHAAGLIFIGPDPAAIELMGNKRAAKLAVMGYGVPVVPGYQGPDQSDATLMAEAKRIGFPLMIKAAAGGGGRGMRLVTRWEEVEPALHSARSEATNAFGSGELILEKAVMGARHVEIQVFGDRHGNVIHLGERDCSVQRRHQKIVEESPSPAVNAALRQRMGEAAVNAARACNYVGAGTVEFILSQDKEFYFLEMNTRLQVEHPVTEMVTGLDLVEWQLRVAAGEPLPLKQEEVRFLGHAIEVRLYAEDPSQNFLPQTGTVRAWQLPTIGAGLRVDHCVYAGMTVSAHYDPMLAKFIAYGTTRDEARRKLARALEEAVLLGVNTNKQYLVSILRHPVFAAGDATTAFIADHMGAQTQADPTPLTWSLAALIRYLSGGYTVTPDASWIGWRSGSGVPSCLRLEAGERRKFVSVLARGRGSLGYCYAVTVQDLDGQFPVGDPITTELEVVKFTDSILNYVHNGVATSLVYATEGAALYLNVDHGNRVIRDATAEAPRKTGASGSGILKAPMDGNVVHVLAQEGDSVTKGQILGIIEAMKMEHAIKADVDGVVKAVRMQKGQQVKGRQILIEITPSLPIETQ